MRVKYILLILLLFCSFLRLVGQGEKLNSQPGYTVFYFLGEDCRICQYYAPTINLLDSLYRSDTHQFQGLFPNRYSNEEGIANYAENHEITIPLKREYFGTMARKFGVTITPEVVLYDEKNDKVLYQGRIDDSYVRVGRRKRFIKSKDLEKAILQLIDGKAIETKATQAIGCYITFK